MFTYFSTAQKIDIIPIADNAKINLNNNRL